MYHGVSAGRVGATTGSRTHGDGGGIAVAGGVFVATLVGGVFVATLIGVTVANEVLVATLVGATASDG